MYYIMNTVRLTVSRNITFQWRRLKKTRSFSISFYAFYGASSSHRSARLYAWLSCYHPHLNAYQRIIVPANHGHTGFKTINIIWKEELDLFPVQCIVRVAHMRALLRTMRTHHDPPSQDTYQYGKRNTAQYLFVFWSVYDWYSHRERHSRPNGNDRSANNDA